jgi:maltooligosyltrehalose trehalohydrolase
MLDEPGDDQWREFYRQLLRLRARHLTPRLRGAAAIGAAPLGQAGVTAAWRLGDGAVLRIAANFGAHGLRLTAAPEPLLFESQPGAASAAAAGELPGFASCVWLDARS